MSEIETFHQSVGFFFYVSFIGAGIDKGLDSIDARFQSVSGLDVQFDTETFKEGGENQFEHVLPTRRKYSDLVLKRGLMKAEGASVLTSWCKEAFDNFNMQPINLQVILLNDARAPLMKWDVTHAWIKNWKMGELNAEKSEILIETLELNYNYFTFKKA